MTEAAPRPTPVHLVTGALGSGKTTLLRRMLADPALADAAVLVNEFGEIGLDHLLLERIDETMVLLQSGCLCCSIREELADAMKALLSRRERGEIPPFRRVAIESSGLADPFPILSTIRSEPVLRHHFTVSSVIATVDAANGLDQVDRQYETVRQIAAADHLLLTKTDLVDRPAIEALESAVGKINPTAAMRTTGGPIDIAALLESGGAMPTPPRGHHHPVGHGVTSVALTFDRPADWVAFGLWLAMLLNRRGEQILRVKAVLNVDGWDGPVALHGVQRLIHPPEHLAAWPDADRRSRLVLIGADLTRDAIADSLAAFGVFGGVAAT